MENYFSLTTYVALFKDYVEAIQSNDFQLLQKILEPSFKYKMFQNLDTFHSALEESNCKLIVQNLKKFDKTDFFLYNIENYLLCGLDLDRTQNLLKYHYSYEENVEFKLGSLLPDFAGEKSLRATQIIKTEGFKNSQPVKLVMRLYFVVGTHLNMYVQDQDNKQVKVGEILGKRSISNRKSHLLTVDKVVGELKAYDLMKSQKQQNEEKVINFVDRNEKMMISDFDNYMEGVTLDQMDVINGIEKLEDKRLQGLANEAIELYLKVLKEYNMQVALSFNGGKDCTVAFHLLRAACAIRDRKLSEGDLNYVPSLLKIQLVDFVKPNEFSEVDEFRKELLAKQYLVIYFLRYQVQVTTFAPDFKKEVQKLLDTTNIKAIILGNRRTDPWSRDLEPICSSSPGWPQFMRVFPVLDWDYTDVWNFLRKLNLSYLSLYDEGYTSLGETNNTIKNPYLKREKEGKEYYLPAYMLEDGEKERESRA